MKDALNPEQKFTALNVRPERRREPRDPLTGRFPPSVRPAPSTPKTAPTPRPSVEPGHDVDVANFLSAKHWTERKLDLPEPLLGEVITNTTRMFIGGPTGLGKTHLGMAMAAAMASGQAFGPWKPSRPCRVLYVDGEMSRDLVQERMHDLQRRMGGNADLTDMLILCREDCEDLAERFPGLGTMEPLNTEAGRDFILRLVDWLSKRRKVDAVFFDNRMSLLSGDMKDEVPWTDTMPLVKALTQKRIAQIWFDHTGHKTDQIYGTKTKEWQFDTVALLTKAENAAADIAFSMEFTKARRRKPSNRSDFAKTTFAMVDDVWSISAVESGNGSTSGRGLTDTQRGWHRDLSDLFGDLDPVRLVPASGCVEVETLTREQAREGLKQKGRFTLDPDGNLTGADREKLRSALNALKDRGKIGLTDKYVWLL